MRYPSRPWIAHLLKPLLVVNVALCLLLDPGSRTGRTSTTRASWAVAVLTFAAVVIRMEIAGLLGLLAIQLLFDGTLSVARLIKVGIISGLVSIGMTPRKSVLYSIHAFRHYSHDSLYRLVFLGSLAPLARVFQHIFQYL